MKLHDVVVLGLLFLPILFVGSVITLGAPDHSVLICQDRVKPQYESCIFSDGLYCQEKKDIAFTTCLENMK